MSIEIQHGDGGIATFGSFPIVYDLDDLNADVAILGMPYENTLGQAGARRGPRGIRDASSAQQYEMRNGYYHPGDEEHYFKQNLKIVDCGDVRVLGCDAEPSFTRLKEMAGKIARSGAFPVFMGGDHSVTTGFLEAMECSGPFGVIHIDAHLDWNSSTSSRFYCQSSPIRRASEMDHVEAIAQFGIRDFPLASTEDYNAALDYGAVIQSVEDVRNIGVSAAVAKIPKCEKYYVTFDIDAMDPSIAPGTCVPSFGGFQYLEAREILKQIAKIGEIVGFDIVEVSPPLDNPGNTTALLAARLISDIVGFVFREKEKRGELTG